LSRKRDIIRTPIGVLFVRLFFLQSVIV